MLSNTLGIKRSKRVGRTESQQLFMVVHLSFLMLSVVLPVCFYFWPFKLQTTICLKMLENPQAGFIFILSYSAQGLTQCINAIAVGDILECMYRVYIYRKYILGFSLRFMSL